MGKITRKKIDITPDTRLMESWRSGGRDIHESLSDLIDNSIDAAFSEENYERLFEKNVIDVKWHSVPDKTSGKDEFAKYAGEEGWLVSDEGSGIPDPESCWIAGKSRKVKSIGRFGVGLKNSTLELGNHVFIRTKREGDDYITTIPFDLSAVKEKGDWLLDQEKEDGAPKKEHFTRVLITDCNVTAPDFEDIFERLSRTYYKMCDKNLTISFQGKPLYWKEPETFELVDEKDVKKRYNIKGKNVKIFSDFDTAIVISKDNQFKIHGWIGIQKEHNQEYDGIDVFLNSRLVEPNSRIGIGANRGRLYGQIFVEQNFSVNYQKTKLDRKSREYHYLNDFLLKEFAPVVEFARRILSNGRYKSPKSVEKATRKFENFLGKVASRAFEDLDELKMNTEIMEAASEDDSIDSGDVDKLVRQQMPEELKKKVVRAIMTNDRKRKSKETFRLPKMSRGMRIEHDAQELGSVEPYVVQYPRLDVLHIVSNASHAYYKEASKFGKRGMIDLHQRHMIDELSTYVSERSQISEKRLKDKIYREMGRHNLKVIK